MVVFIASLDHLFILPSSQTHLGDFALGDDLLASVLGLEEGDSLEVRRDHVVAVLNHGVHVFAINAAQQVLRLDDGTVLHDLRQAREKRMESLVEFVTGMERRSTLMFCRQNSNVLTFDVVFE